MSKLAELLIHSEDYRIFLANAPHILKEENSSWSFEYFAKASGFASKSYVRAIFAGKKRLSANALPKFIHGFKLNKELSRYFSLLVFSTESDLDPEGLSKEQISSQLVHIRSRLVQRQEKRQNNGETAPEFEYYYWPIIYAALGTLEKGSNFLTIKNRTKIEESHLRENLALMIEKRVISFDKISQCYKAKDFHLLFEFVKKDTAVKNFFLRSLLRASQAIKYRYDDERKIFYSAAFSINQSKMKSFNSALMATIYQLLEENEDPDGSDIMEVAISSFPWEGKSPPRVT